MNKNRNKDSAMAAYMKSQGIVRTTMRCPLCHFPAAISAFPTHLHMCKGRGKVTPKAPRAAKAPR